MGVSKNITKINLFFVKMEMEKRKMKKHELKLV